MSAVIRKIVTVVEETHIEMGKAIAPPTRRAAAIAVIENPFAGRYVEDLSPLIAIGEELGELTEGEIESALDAGARHGRALLAAGLIEGAALRLLGETVIVGARQCEPYSSQQIHKRGIERAMHA